MGYRKPNPRILANLTENYIIFEIIESEDFDSTFLFVKETSFSDSLSRKNTFLFFKIIIVHNLDSFELGLENFS